MQLLKQSKHLDYISILYTILIRQASIAHIVEKRPTAHSYLVQRSSYAEKKVH